MGECYGVRCAKAALPVVAGPPDELLEPETHGATMEATKWLKLWIPDVSLVSGLLTLACQK